jgi:carbon monoxide dehydrogenase subunit G
VATILLEIEIARSKAAVWDAIRDVGAIHTRLVRGFVVDCRLEGGSRVVTFANGMSVRELIVSVDDEACRHSWSARGEPLTHHNASVQVFHAGDGRSRVVWIADLLPDEAANTVREMISQGLKAMRTTLESDAGGD